MLFSLRTAPAQAAWISDAATVKAQLNPENVNPFVNRGDPFQAVSVKEKISVDDPVICVLPTQVDIPPALASVLLTTPEATTTLAFYAVHLQGRVDTFLWSPNQHKWILPTAALSILLPPPPASACRPRQVLDACLVGEPTSHILWAERLFSGDGAIPLLQAAAPATLPEVRCLAPRLCVPIHLPDTAPATPLRLIRPPERSEKWCGPHLGLLVPPTPPPQGAAAAAPGQGLPHTGGIALMAAGSNAWVVCPPHVAHYRHPAAGGPGLLHWDQVPEEASEEAGAGAAPERFFFCTEGAESHLYCLTIGPSPSTPAGATAAASATPPHQASPAAALPSSAPTPAGSDAPPAADPPTNPAPHLALEGLLHRAWCCPAGLGDGRVGSAGPHVAGWLPLCRLALPGPPADWPHTQPLVHRGFLVVLGRWGQALVVDALDPLLAEGPLRPPEGPPPAALLLDTLPLPRELTSCALWGGYSAQQGDEAGLWGARCPALYAVRCPPVAALAQRIVQQAAHRGRHVLDATLRAATLCAQWGLKRQAATLALRCARQCVACGDPIRLRYACQRLGPLLQSPALVVALLPPAEQLYADRLIGNFLRAYEGPLVVPPPGGAAAPASLGAATTPRGPVGSSPAAALLLPGPSALPPGGRLVGVESVTEAWWALVSSLLLPGLPPGPPGPSGATAADPALPPDGTGAPGLAAPRPPLPGGGLPLAEVARAFLRSGPMELRTPLNATLHPVLARLQEAHAGRAPDEPADAALVPGGHPALLGPPCPERDGRSIYFGPEGAPGGGAPAAAAAAAAFLSGGVGGGGSSPAPAVPLAPLRGLDEGPREPWRVGPAEQEAAERLLGIPGGPEPGLRPDREWAPEAAAALPIRCPTFLCGLKHLRLPASEADLRLMPRAHLELLGRYQPLQTLLALERILGLDGWRQFVMGGGQGCWHVSLYQHHVPAPAALATGPEGGPWPGLGAAEALAEQPLLTHPLHPLLVLTEPDDDGLVRTPIRSPAGTGRRNVPPPPLPCALGWAGQLMGGAPVGLLECDPGPAGGSTPLLAPALSSLLGTAAPSGGGPSAAAVGPSTRLGGGACVPGQPGASALAAGPAAAHLFLASGRRGPHMLFGLLGRLYDRLCPQLVAAFVWHVAVGTLLALVAPARAAAAPLMGPGSEGAEGAWGSAEAGGHGPRALSALALSLHQSHAPGRTPPAPGSEQAQLECLLTPCWFPHDPAQPGGRPPCPAHGTLAQAQAALAATTSGASGNPPAADFPGGSGGGSSSSSSSNGSAAIAAAGQMPSRAPSPGTPGSGSVGGSLLALRRPEDAAAPLGGPGDPSAPTPASSPPLAAPPCPGISAAAAAAAGRPLGSPLHGRAAHLARQALLVVAPLPAGLVGYRAPEADAAGGEGALVPEGDRPRLVRLLQGRAQLLVDAASPAEALDVLLQGGLWREALWLVVECVGWPQEAPAQPATAESEPSPMLPAPSPPPPPPLPQAPAPAPAPRAAKAPPPPSDEEDGDFVMVSMGPRAPAPASRGAAFVAPRPGDSAPTSAPRSLFPGPDQGAPPAPPGARPPPMMATPGTPPHAAPFYSRALHRALWGALLAHFRLWHAAEARRPVAPPSSAATNDDGDEADPPAHFRPSPALAAFAEALWRLAPGPLNPYDLLEAIGPRPAPTAALSALHRALLLAAAAATTTTTAPQRHHHEPLWPREGPFRYPGCDRILREMFARAAAGQRRALVGASAAPSSAWSP
ncbi:hypothetical protein PAPYR_3127 [Paratrimastix pyriformis]|uniref:Anaphase-promoting complex subunit 1 n=1 Tax=Paratrimastix pyriformis TaxID=342808 RepID=A0ABQ8UMV7_9EUKA|nr:hypothetical protein PAPYR_3127 [Paratrimastix pyriformis]